MRLNRSGSCALVLTAAALTNFTSGAASARAIVNFDTFPGGAPVPNGTLITTQYSSVGVLFSSPAPAGGPLAGVFSGEATSGPNFLMGLDPASMGGLHPIIVDFVSLPASSVNMNLISVGGGTVTATAYAGDFSTVLDSISVTRGPGGGNGFGNVDPIMLTGTGIARVRVEIFQTGPVLDGYGIDDLDFMLVPSPGTAAMLAAFSLISTRRRR